MILSKCKKDETTFAMLNMDLNQIGTGLIPNNETCTTTLDDKFVKKSGIQKLESNIANSL